MPEFNRTAKLGRTAATLTTAQQMARLFKAPVPSRFLLTTYGEYLQVAGGDPGSATTRFIPYDPANSIRLTPSDAMDNSLSAVDGHLPGGTVLRANNDETVTREIDGILPPMAVLLSDARWVDTETGIVDRLVTLNADWRERVEIQDDDERRKGEPFANVVSIPRHLVPPIASEYKPVWVRLINEQSSEEILIAGDGAATQISYVREYAIRTAVDILTTDWLQDDGHDWNISAVNPPGRGTVREFRASRTEQLR